MGKSFSESVKSFGMNQLLKYISKDPIHNMEKMIDRFSELDRSGTISSQLAAVRDNVIDENSNWNHLIEDIYNEVDPDVRDTLIQNTIVNATIVGYSRGLKIAEKENCNIPYAILMDPTSACNLHCTGCWAAEYGNAMNLSLEELDNIINQGTELGTYVYLYTGGEPMVRKKDLIKLCEMHPDCTFLSFTNGTLIDEEFADEMLRVKNFVPAISVEGFEEATDERRGKGTYAKTQEAMRILREKHLFFGASVCYTSQNTDVIGSEEYIDSLIEDGCRFAWFFTYMPVGVNAVPELMASPEQREFMYDRIREYRETKKIFTLDFFNDGEYVNGCIAGGRHYMHINANGDIEPCAFIHYSDSNVREKTLLEAYKSPMFMAYHDNQPFNNNHLRPCPLLDNSGKLAEMVDETGAKSTDLEHPEDVHDLNAKTKKMSEDWAPVADRMWENAIETGTSNAAIAQRKNK